MRGKQEVTSSILVGSSKIKEVYIISKLSELICTPFGCYLVGLAAETKKFGRALLESFGTALGVFQKTSVLHQTGVKRYCKSE